MVNRYTLGSIVLGIFLLAILGVSRAMSWLGQSTATTTPDERIIAIESDGTQATGNASRLSQTESQAESQANGQTNGQFDNQTLSQADSIDSASSDTNLALLPLEEAGTFIQRQKRVEEDKIVTNTKVNVIPVANNSVAAQGDTVTPQAPATTTTTPSAPRPAATGNNAPAVPALW